MKFKWNLLLAVSGGLFGLATNVHAKFLPDNNLYLEDFRESNGGISEVEFNDVINKAEAVYKPIIESHGGNLSVYRFWSDSTVNAMAYRDLSEWAVGMYGGLARRPEITKDGFTMVLCHEIGHHLAGFPFDGGAGRWPANEGNSDYFAALSCSRNLWLN